MVCGMTGTAVTVGEQLREFYGLEVAVIPPNRPCVREDEPDRLYRDRRAEGERDRRRRWPQAHATGRPVLIGTLDVAESERLASRLTEAGLPCVVLNAKNDADEAAIVAEAGRDGAITVSTQMAGRGTDIRLGGTGGDRDEVAALGGLYVIGTGRHASSRLDHQLRGRAGRQGDPGGSVFFVSMEDELITTCVPDAEPPAARWTAGGRVRDAKAHWTVGHAQRVAEGVHLQIHRDTWRYNELIEDQRRAVLALPRPGAAHRCGAERPGRVRPGPGRRTAAPRCPRTCWPRRPGRSPCPTWTGPGRSTWPRRPTSGRASTCAPSGTARTRSAARCTR